MKKALALVLALVLALSMAVSAFGLVALTPVPAAPADMIEVEVVNNPYAEPVVLYTTQKGEYYIALEDVKYTDIKLTANGIVSAELVEYNPEKMIVTGMDIFYNITKEGEVIYSGLDYKTAKNDAAYYNNADRVTYYGYELATNVNIIKVTVADNFSAAYKEGTLKIDAIRVADKKACTTTLGVIADVTIFEYEQVKWAAANIATGAELVCAENENGYSDYVTAMNGYDADKDDKYEIEELRVQRDAAVISTTAFRAITGKDVAVACGDMTVTLKAVAAAQKGVNFKHYGVNPVYDLAGNVVAVEFGFKGDQVVVGDYTVAVDLGYNWFTLRELFGVKVEEDDIISYYVLKNGKVVKEIVVDYMTANVYEEVVLELNGSNSALGQYEIVMEVPAVEGETNPNTGAESVVGVVAALAVVSVATAAAVSLKK